MVEIRPEDVEEFLPDAADLVLHDPSDENELVWVLDRHDVEQILMEVQRRALKVWIYDIPGDGGKRRRELSYKGVRDIIALMNRTGRVKIGLLPETLKLERFREDIGNGGPEPFARATIFARDEVTEQVMPGVSTEPLYLKLTKAKAAAKRKDGKDIPADDRVFDPFAETKATNKAARNALRTFIPEELAQTVIAMYSKDPSYVERIRSEAEQAIEELPPPLDDDEAKGLLARSREVQDEIAAIGPQALVECPPGLVASYRMRSQHSHDMLRDFIAWLERRRDELRGKFGGAS